MYQCQAWNETQATSDDTSLDVSVKYWPDGAPSKVSHRLLRLMRLLTFAKREWPCPLFKMRMALPFLQDENGLAFSPE